MGPRTLWYLGNVNGPNVAIAGAMVSQRFDEVSLMTA